MKRVVLLTGSELRHTYFRKYLGSAPDLEILRTFCESEKGNLSQLVREDSENALRLNHLRLRTESEMTFFEAYCQTTEDHSHPVFLEKGDINQEQFVQEIIALSPDVIVSYGCSIIKSRLLEVFEGRFINVHLGLSPYYRGSGTNFWPLVNCEPELVGVTFMHIDAGIDTGKIFHQIRATIQPDDTVHEIGNRLIRDFVSALPYIITQFDRLLDMPQLEKPQESKYYRSRDFNEASLETLYQNFENGMITAYLEHKSERDQQYPILENPAL